MYYADEVRDFGEIPKGQATTTEAELTLASRLVEGLSETTFQPEQFRDEYRDRLLEVIQHKAEGKDVMIAPQEQPAQVVDLMDALKASLERGPKQLRRRGAKAVRVEAVPAKKTAARR
jgi:DNA end-binding protein Ku